MCGGGRRGEEGGGEGWSELGSLEKVTELLGTNYESWGGGGEGLAGGLTFSSFSSSVRTELICSFV